MNERLVTAILRHHSSLQDCNRKRFPSLALKFPLDSQRLLVWRTMLSLESRNRQVEVQASSPPVDALYAPLHVSPANEPSTGGGLSRAKSLFSFASVASEESSDMDAAENCSPDLSRPLRDSQPRGVIRNANASSFHEALEPYLRSAREERQRNQKCEIADVHLSIAGSVSVPYTALRNERPFLFDEHAYPLHEALAETLRVGDLSELHKLPENEMLQPLLHLEQRRIFHAAYDSFVSSFILPLCHSLAIAKNVLHVYSSEKIHYRYQAFPNIRIIRPGDKPSMPTCGLSDGYSIANLQFHVPLTPAVESNALYTETHQGREDWHPLNAKSCGLGYMFDGARCLHFDAGNTTEQTRVAIDFRVCIYREPAKGLALDPRSGDFPTSDQLMDSFSKKDANFYEEAVIDLSRSDIVVKTSSRKKLLEPSKLLGTPFDI